MINCGNVTRQRGLSHRCDWIGNIRGKIMEVRVNLVGVFVEIHLALPSYLVTIVFSSSWCKEGIFLIGIYPSTPPSPTPHPLHTWALFPEPTAIPSWGSTLRNVLLSLPLLIVFTALSFPSLSFQLLAQQWTHETKINTWMKQRGYFILKDAFLNLKFNLRLMTTP